MRSGCVGVINSVSGGGIFMSPKATMQEAADIARNMSKKFTVTEPQIGGAKAGIRFDHTDPRAKEVLRRFILDNANLLNNVWVTAGDLNTSDEFIIKVVQEELGLTTSQDMLSKAIVRSMRMPDRSMNLSAIIRHPACEYFPLIEGAVGYGVSEGIRAAVQFTAPAELHGNVRVVIQGFGAVGSSLAYYIQKRGIGKVVAIADKDGFVHDKAGLDVVALLDARMRHRAELVERGVSGAVLSESDKNLICNLNEEEQKRFNVVLRAGRSSPQMLEELIKTAPAEVFSPCALRYTVTEDVVGWLGRMWKKANVKSKYLVCGANNPYGVLDGVNLVEDRSGRVAKLLQEQFVCVVPDWVANSGTAQLFHRALSLPFDLRQRDLAQLVLDACAAPITRYVRMGLDLVEGKKQLLAEGCEILAAQLLEKPRLMADSVRNPGGSVYAFPAPINIPYTPEERVRMVSRCMAEVVSEAELLALLSSCNNPVCYDGFEPSGRMHVAQGILKRNIVNSMTKCGFTFLFWVADWFAMLNHKMGGDLEKIRDVGRYFVEVWRSLGMDMTRVKFLWASDEINSRADEYWSLVLKISAANSLTRIKRTTKIMGRTEESFAELSASQVMYPCMQCADVFFLGVDVCQLGLDQRKVNVLAREYCDKIGRTAKPIIMSHVMLPGLHEGQEKMSKSMPSSALYMDDSAKEISSKINSAWCPEKVAEGNPVLAYFKHLVFSSLPEGSPVAILRAEKYGGDVVFESYEALEKAYSEGAVYPKDLKDNLARYINEQLEPVRAHFASDPVAKSLQERVHSYQVTK